MFDVIVIGVGVIGASIIRELTRLDISVLGIEAREDFSLGSSGANSGIVHAGYDAKPGTLKAKFNVLGNRLYKQWSEELDFPYINNGALVVCHSEDELPALYDLKHQGDLNGVQDMEILDREQVHALEPNLSERVYAALYLKTSGICYPFEFVFACTENAAHNGAQFVRGERVKNILKTDGGYKVITDSNEYETKCIVNSAGIYSDKINDMVSSRHFEITPVKGEYLLMDDRMGSMFSSTIFNLPTNMGKGVLISRTIDNNLFLGPTAVRISDREDTSVSAESYDLLLSQAKNNWDDIPRNRFITSFAGIRAKTDVGDFIIGEADDSEGFFNAAGIESPGLTSAPAIAEYIRDLIRKRLECGLKASFDPIRKSIIKVRELSLEEKNTLISEKPEYGHIICRCNMVSEGEIIEAVKRGAVNMDGVKKRVRAGMGKCQGGFCSPAVLDLISRYANIPKESVTKHGKGSEILVGDAKGF